MKKIYALIVITLLQLVLNSAFACELKETNFFSSAASFSSVELSKEATSSQIISHENSSHKDKNSKSKENNCDQCGICHHIVAINTISRFSFVILRFDTSILFSSFIYKQPFVRFDQKPPIKA